MEINGGGKIVSNEIKIKELVKRTHDLNHSHGICVVGAFGIFFHTIQYTVLDILQRMCLGSLVFSGCSFFWLIVVWASRNYCTTYSRRRVGFHGRVKDTVVKLWPYQNWDERSLQLRASVAVRYASEILDQMSTNRGFWLLSCW